MSNNVTTSSGAGTGIGMGGILFIVFLVLKLCNVIDWSWWWVTSPIWIPVGLCLFGFLIGIAIIWFKR